MRIKHKTFAFVVMLFLYLQICGFSWENTEAVTYDIPSNSGFKCYMDYRTITDTESKQYKLQKECTTDEYGIRIYNDRYCIAVGTFCNAQIGQNIDLVLNNGAIIKCVVADIKANKDTDNSNIFSQNGCCSEFIVDTDKINTKISYTGNISNMFDAWKYPVNTIIVYKGDCL